MFLVALGLHVGLLFVPVSGSSDEVIPAPDPEGETISVTRIPTEDSQQPSAVAKPTTSPQPTAAKPAQATRSAQQAQSGSPRANAQQGSQSSRTANGDASRGLDRNPGRNTQGGDRNANNRNANNRNANNRNANNRNANNRNVDEEIANLDTPSPPPPSSRDTPPTNNSTPIPQQPLTLAALLEKAQRPVPERLKELLVLFSKAYNYQALQTTDSAETQARDSWLAGIRDRMGLPGDLEPLETPITIPYPLEREESFLEAYGDYQYDLDFVVCLEEAPKPAVVGIAFDQAGAIADEAPMILRGTGYEFLNQEALERVKQYEDFPPDKAQKAYTIDVEIDHDDERCPVLPEAEVAEGDAAE